MATVRLQKNGRWQAIIRKKGHTPISKTFTKEDDARKWARGAEVDIERHVFVDTKEAATTTLTEALERYDEVARTNKGYKAEKTRIKAWKNTKLASRAIVTLRSKDFDKYRDHRRAEGTSDATIRNDLAVIAAVFKHFDYGIPNPVINTVRTLSVAEKRSRRLSALEHQYLMAQLDNTRCSDTKRSNKWLLLVTHFAIETAARLSEIVGKDKTMDSDAVPGLLWENVNIEKSVAKFIDTKNGESRFVPLSPAAIKCLEQAKVMNPALSGPVFLTSNSAINQSWRRAKQRARNQYKADGGQDEDFLVDFRFHDNRHEAASRWARIFDTKQLQLVTGHKDIRSLMRYVNPDEDDVSLIAARMAEAQRG